MDELREESIALCEKLRPNRCMDTPDQSAYYEARVEVENWLRDRAISAGVNIRAQNPVYFTLTHRPEASVPGRQIVSLPAETVDLSCCSFTFDDSFINHEPARRDFDHPLRGVVLNVEQIATALKTHGIMGSYRDDERYIEVQMWGRPNAVV